MANPRLRKKLKTPPILRLRVRCEEDHKDPWLRRLYVLWAVLPPETKQGEKQESPSTEEPPKPPTFYLGQTSVEGKTRKHKGRSRGGYLAPLASENDPKLTKAIPQAPDTTYQFYFVRHPGADLPKQMLKKLNDSFDKAKAEYGEPHKLTTSIEEVGKKKKKELVLKIPEDPKYFLPKGSEFYDGWVLFRDMPGSGSNLRAKDIQCPDLEKQVIRLQFHLGQMRYLVGVASNPYLPSAKRLFNRGLFETVTWNSVIKWQGHASDGAAIELPKPVSGTLDSAFDPAFELTATKRSVRDARNIELARSHSFVKGIPAAADKALVSDAGRYRGVVGLEAGDGVKQWLENKLRKPGRILVQCPDCNGWPIWIASDLYPTVLAVDLLLKALGCPGFGANATYRDARSRVRSAGGGAIVQSIHKSGLALDLAMSAYTAPRSSTGALQLFYGPHSQSKYPARSMRWTIWAEADAARVETFANKSMVEVLTGILGQPEFADVPAELKDASVLAPLIEFKNSIEVWQYNPDSPAGGASQVLASPGKSYLNLTKLIAPPSPFMLKPISAHKRGWQALPTEIDIEDRESYGRFVSQLGRFVGRNVEPIVINSTTYPSDALRGFQRRHQQWAKHLGKYGADPTVRIDPQTKTGQRVMKRLRSYRSLRGEVIIEADAADAHELCLPPPAERVYNMLNGRVTLSQEKLDHKTDFPKFNFYVTPVTDPLLYGDVSTKFPLVSGIPNHMEWWHFQWLAGYKGELWADLVKEIGWTDEGLGWCTKSGKEYVFEKTIYGHGGLGYPATGKSKRAN
jgi:hypothetical protein